MASFNLSVDTSYLLLSRAKELGMTEEELVLHLLRSTSKPIEGAMTFDQAKGLALMRAQSKKPGAEFRLEELFSKAEWTQLPSKKHLGRYFRKDAEHLIVEHIGKTDTNHAIYRRL